MVRHEAEGMADPIVSFNHLRQHVQKSLAILIILVNRFAPVTSGGDVIQGTGKLYTKGSGHGQSLADADLCYNARTDPTPPACVLRDMRQLNGDFVCTAQRTLTGDRRKVAEGDQEVRSSLRAARTDLARVQSST